MEVLGIRQFMLLLLGVSMVTVGYLGLTGGITGRSVVIAGCLVVVSMVSFSLGRRSAQLGRG